MHTNHELPTFIPQGFMFVPSVITSCSPAAPSTSTHPPGQPSLRPSVTTACPSIKRDLEHIRHGYLLCLLIEAITIYMMDIYINYNDCWQLSTPLYKWICECRVCEMRDVLFQVLCGKCGNGLGHEFVNDGPSKGLSRFWIFSSSLKFIPKGTNCEIVTQDWLSLLVENISCTPLTCRCLSLLSTDKVDGQ